MSLGGRNTDPLSATFFVTRYIPHASPPVGIPCIVSEYRKKKKRNIEIGKTTPHLFFGAKEVMANSNFTGRQVQFSDNFELFYFSRPSTF